MRFILPGLISLFSAFPLAAETVNPETRLGLARIVDGASGNMALMLGEHFVELPNAPHLAFIEARRGDLLLIALASGGNVCPAEYVWVHATPGDIRTSEVFGTCSDLIEVSHDRDTVRVTMPSMQGDEGDVTFVYNGHGPVERVVVGHSPSGMGPEGGPQFWLGRYPFELIAASDWRPAFLSVMDEAAYGEAQRVISLASPMRREGEWIVGEGCPKGECDTRGGAVAVHIATGAVMAALWEAGQRARIYGNPGGPLPPTFVNLLGR
jgi:hypothetical protein